VLVASGLLVVACGLLLAAPQVLGTGAQATQESLPATSSTSPGTSFRPATLDTPDHEQVDEQFNKWLREVAVQQQRVRELNRRNTDDLFQTLADSHPAP
jgi:hypothetical protein